MNRSGKSLELCVTVTGSDQSGIIASITRIFYGVKGNLEDASMTILNGEFAMIFIVSLAATKISALLKKLEVLEKKLKLNIAIRKIKRKNRSRTPKLTLPYLISAFGRDKVGIVFQISEVLAKSKLNITDLQSKQIPTGKEVVYGLLLEVEIPKSFKIEALRSQLLRIAKSLKVDLTLKSIDPITL